MNQQQDIIERNRGVILRYVDPGQRRRHHDERTRQPSDGERIAILKAEHALIVIEIICAHLELSGIALTRIEDALHEIHQALQLKRKHFDMSAGVA